MTIDDGGEEKTFKPSGRDRGIWTRLLEALPTEWARIELQDKDGAILWGLDSPTSGTAAPMQLGKGTVVDQVSALLKLMLQAQDVALARQGETISKLTAGYETLAQTMTSRLQSLEQLTSTLLQATYEATIGGAETQAALLEAMAQGGGNSTGMDMLAKLVGIKLRKTVPANGHRQQGTTPPKEAPKE